ncbi:MAG: hypothetical protein D6780_03870, partial [Candidatus Dadabacteria bacterium]
MNEDIFKALEKLAGSSVLVIGDIILDQYVWGKVERISPEAPVPVVRIEKGESRLGGAANVAKNLKDLGVNVSIAGVVGADTEGKEILELLDKENINFSNVLSSKDTCTVTKTRVIAHSQQVVRLDKEESNNGNTESKAGLELAQHLEDFLQKKISQFNAVVVSDYAKGAVTERLLTFLAKLSRKGYLSVKERPYLLDPHPNHSSLYKRVSVVKPNKKETEWASGVKINEIKDAVLAAKKLQKLWKVELVVITLGEEGMILYGNGVGEGVHLPTTAKEVFDVSGAGDTVIAVLSAALGAQVPPLTAGKLANLAAGIVVQEVGTASV